MTHLSVNVNKLATLRNSRGKNTPDVAQFAKKILDMKVHGLTVHPRPDGRHIRTADVWNLSHLVNENNKVNDQSVEFNIEGYPSEDFLSLVRQVRPHQVTLVPDPPDVLTSNAGWNLEASETLLGQVLGFLHGENIRTSLFIDPNQFQQNQRDTLLRLRPGRIELYTEEFAEAYPTERREEVVMKYADAAAFADSNGIGVNAGHDLNQLNLGYLLDRVPNVREVSIGHALFCEAIEQGLSTTIANYMRIIADHGAHGPRA